MVPEGVDAVDDTRHVLLVIHIRYSGVEDFGKLDGLHCIDVLDDVVRVSERQPLGLHNTATATTARYMRDQRLNCGV